MKIKIHPTYLGPTEIEVPDFEKPPEFILYYDWPYALASDGEYYEVVAYNTKWGTKTIHYLPDDDSEEAACGDELVEWGGATRRPEWVTCKKCRAMIK